MRVHTATRVESLDRRDGRLVAALGPAGEVAVDKVVLAVGIVGNVENLGLEGNRRAGRERSRGRRSVAAHRRARESARSAIWSARRGSRTRPSHEGVLCVEKIAGVDGVHPLDVRNVPGCTYCRPQVASLGLTEAAARDGGRDVRVGRFPFVGNGKAIALGEPDGLVKTVFDAATGELLGAHMIGAEVTELIQGYAVAKGMEGTEEDLMRTVFPHPTISESMHESVLDAWGRALHI